MVSCNVLTRSAHNLKWQMNLAGFVCVPYNWRNKFQIECSERRVLLRLAFSFRLVSKFFMTYWYEVLTTGRSLFSSRTSAAFLFWFLLWFACILVFSFELCVDVALLELTFGCFDCFVRRLFSLLCLPLAVVCFFLPRFQYRNWNFMIRIAVRGLQFLLKKLIYHLANQSIPTELWNLAPNRNNLSR